MRQANWYMIEGGSPSERRSSRTTFPRKPCADTREGQAKRRQRCVRAELWSVEKDHMWSAETPVEGRRQHRTGRYGETLLGCTASKNSGTYVRHISGPGRPSGRPGGSPGPQRKGVRLDQR